MSLKRVVLKKNTTWHLLILTSIFVIGGVLFALLMIVNHRIVGSDDTIFQTQILPYSTVVEWVQYRYFNWSGRVFSEGFVYLLSPAPFIIWQILNVVAYTIGSFFLFLYYRLFSASRSIKKDYLMAAVALCIPYLMHKAVLADGAIWMTGSIVYFWTTVLGMIALYPITYYLIRQKMPHLGITVLGLIIAIIAAIAQEQVGALLLGLTFVCTLYIYINRIRQKSWKVPYYPLIFLTVITGAFLVGFLAPGNTVRLDLELVRWLPDFYDVPLLDRIHYSYRWMLDALINHAGLLLSVSWVSMGLLFMSKAKRTFLDYLLAGILIIMAIFTIAKGSEFVSYWFEFYASWKAQLLNPIVALNIIPWGIGLLLTICAPLLLYKRKPIGILLSILYLAAFAATAIMILSPTLYASAWRSLFVPSMLLGFIVYLLLDRVFDNYTKQRTVILCVIASLALSQYIFQIARLIQD